MSPKAALAVASIGLALSSAGCATWFPSPITPDTGKPAEGPRRDFLAMGGVSWSRGEEVIVTMSPDGVIRDHDVVIGALRADGTFKTRHGKRSLVMDPDGTVHVGPGFDVQIGADGTAVTRVHGQPDETTTLQQAGQPRGGQPGLTLQSATPGMERTVMWVLMIPDLLRALGTTADD
jgi:hypothetical protein